jgi:hypothetical protein
MRAVGVIVAVVISAGDAAADDPLPDTYTTFAPEPPVAPAYPDVPHVDNGPRPRGATVVDPAEARPLEAHRIDQVFRSQVSRFRACYAGAIIRRPAEFRRPRKLVVAVDIGADGRLRRVNVATAVTPELDRCMVNRIMRLRFPRSGGAVVHYPFVFGAI